tara:strand:- start:218 stop:469 length:252 start_codon:yes stop_codon:yes gene_type:complete
MNNQISLSKLQSILTSSEVVTLRLTLQWRKEDNIRDVVKLQKELEEVDGEKFPSTKLSLEKLIDFLEKNIDDIDNLVEKLNLK